MNQHQHREKIVVTGGAGFIGSHLVDRLLAESRAEIVVFDNLSRGRLTNLPCPQRERRLHLVEGDVRDAKAVAQTLQGASVVYHLAAQSKAEGQAANIDELFSTNVVGTFNVLRAAARHAVSQVIFASSSEAYGEPVSLPVDEGHPLLTISPYGASKAAGEVYCRTFRQAFGLQSAVIRIADVYGPRDFGRPIPLWLEHARAGQHLQVHGGKQIADFVWVGQTVEALVRAATLELALPTINVASGTGTRVMDLARRIARLAGGQVQIKLLPACAMQPTRFVANVDRMREILKIEPLLDPLVHLESLLPTPVGAAS